MYKLYLTLDNEKGNKIERILNITESIHADVCNSMVHDMVDSMEKVEKENQEEELKNEAQRQISNDKANS